LVKSSEEGQDSQDSQDGLNVVAASKQTGYLVHLVNHVHFKLFGLLVSAPLRKGNRAAWTYCGTRRAQHGAIALHRGAGDAARCAPGGERLYVLMKA
jgi:hypothetical protein